MSWFSHQEEQSDGFVILEVSRDKLDNGGFPLVQFASDKLYGEGFPMEILACVILSQVIFARWRLAVRVLRHRGFGHGRLGLWALYCPMACLGPAGIVLQHGSVALLLGCFGLSGAPAPGLLSAPAGGLGAAPGHPLLLLGVVGLALVEFFSKQYHFESQLFYLITEKTSEK